jgi:hypothetical protein
MWLVQRNGEILDEKLVCEHAIEHPGELVGILCDSIPTVCGQLRVVSVNGMPVSFVSAASSFLLKASSQASATLSRVILKLSAAATCGAGVTCAPLSAATLAGIEFASSVDFARAGCLLEA